MKKLLFILVAAVLVLGGCSTIDNRIQEKAAVFGSFDAETQARLKRGAIRVGDTFDMVYIAVGHPDRVREKTTSNSTEVTWAYTAQYEEYEGRRFVGYERRAYVDRRDGVIRSAYRPVAADVYSTYTDEYLRIVFRDGKVISIERDQPGD